MEASKLEMLKTDFECKKEDVKFFTSRLKDIKKTTYMENLLSFTGGIVGIFARMSQEKKLSKFLETPILEGMTYQQLAEHLGELSTPLVDTCKQIQSIISKDDPYYYDIVRQSVKVLEDCISAWYNIAPSIADERLKTSDGTRSTLREYAYSFTFQPLRTLDLPKDF